MATTVSYGKCEACGQSNPMSLQVCRKCGADLPWVKKKAVKAAPQPKVRTPQATSSLFENPLKPPKPVLSAEEKLTLWAIGTVVFLICFSFPAIGYLVNRILTNQESDLAGFAGAGLFCSVIIWALFFVSVMSKVGHSPTP